jgi:hypothetical protein
MARLPASVAVCVRSSVIVPAAGDRSCRIRAGSFIARGDGPPAREFDELLAGLEQIAAAAQTDDDRAD